MFWTDLIVLFVTLSTTLVSVNTISCYECNSANDTECHDLDSYRPQLRAHYSKECDNFGRYAGNTPFWRKTVLEKERRTIRSCGWIKYHQPCYKAENDDHIENSCQCFENGCNGSSQVYMFSVLPLLMLASLCYVRIL